MATRAEKLNPDDVRVLTEWRNRFVKSFLTEFAATEARTAAWLTDVVGPDPTRILFMLDDARTHGRLPRPRLYRLATTHRRSRRDRSRRGSRPGVMAKAMFTLLDWGYEQLELTKLGARVRSDNPSLRFFLKISKETKRAPAPDRRAGDSSLD